MTEAGDARPAPVRYHLTGAQLATALAAAGLSPSGRSDLPPLPPPGDPAGLAGTGLVGGDGALTPAAHLALGLAAAPSRAVVVLANDAGRPVCTEAVFLTGSDAEHHALLAHEGDGVDLALLTPRDAAVVLVGDMLGITDLPAAAGPAAVSLDLVGFAALAAVADVVQDSRLRARLQRRLDPPLPALSPEALEDAMGRGLGSPDTRWACCLIQLVFPAESLRGIRGRLPDGIRSLEQAGLVATTGGAPAPTEAGMTLIDPLTRLVGGGSLSGGYLSDQGRVATGHLSILRAAGEIVVGAWGSGGDQARVTVALANRTQTMRLIEGMLEPPPA